MKEMLKQYAAYHVWANQLLIDLILSLPEDVQQKEIKSSFPGLFPTLLHMLDAESIWWQRMKLEEKIVIPSQVFSGGMKDLAAQVKQLNKQWWEWVSQATEAQLQHEFKYQNSKREGFKQPIFQVLIHMFNHGTYHRGQLVTILRQLGIEKIPQTDFIIWSRKK